MKISLVDAIITQGGYCNRFGCVYSSIMVMSLQQLTCQRCGHQWLPRIFRTIRQCPGCGSRKWDQPPPPPPEQFSCQRCGHQWLGRSLPWRSYSTRPNRCPRCQTDLWDKPRPAPANDAGGKAQENGEEAEA